MKWMSMQPAIKSDRYLMAQTEWTSAWENDDDDDLMSALSYTDGGDSEGQHKYLNFSNQAARSVSDTIHASHACTMGADSDEGTSICSRDGRN